MNTIETNEYKTITQIEAETDTNNVRFPRPLDYVREMALTQFIRDVESQNEDFKLKIAHPRFIFPRNNPSDVSPVFSIGMWAEFSIGETTFHFSMNENVFFTVNISRSMNLDLNTKLAEYWENTNYADIVYQNWDCSTDDKALTLITKNLHAAFRSAQLTPPKWIKKNTPATSCAEKQMIYRN